MGSDVDLMKISGEHKETAFTLDSVAGVSLLSRAEASKGDGLPEQELLTVLLREMICVCDILFTTAEEVGY